MNSDRWTSKTASADILRYLTTVWLYAKLHKMRNEATVIQTDMQADLIAAFARHGVEVSRKDIPVILNQGADSFLLRRGVVINENALLEIYLILTEMKGL